MISYLVRYVIALLVTLAVEALIVAALARRRHRWHAAKTSLCLNLFTHPLANRVFTGTLGSFIAVEAAVVLVETWLYAWIEHPGLRRALLWSVVANGVTMAMSPLF